MGRKAAGWFHALPLVQRVLRDLRRGRVEAVRIDSRESCVTVRDFARAFIPELIDRINDPRAPIFDLYSIEDEIRKALEHKVR